MNENKPENPYDRFVESVGETTVLLLFLSFGSGMIVGMMLLSFLRYLGW